MLSSHIENKGPYMKINQIKDELIGRRVNSHIYSVDGHLLLNKGTVVNSSILSRLERYNMNIEDLLNSLSKDIKPVGLINDKQMDESIQVVKNVFDYVLYTDKVGIASAIPPDYLELVEDVVKKLIDALENTGNLLYTVSDMVEKATYTYKHSVNVAILSILTSKALNYRESDIKNIALGAFLHDIGKMLVDQKLITKPGRLTDSERIAVEKHPTFGYELIKEIETLSFTTKQIVLLHHEKLDGSGYPSGLKGIEIPEYVRLVTICDMYDAMTTNRVYRGKMPIYTVLEILMTDAVFKLDRKIYRHMSQNICIYPPGSGVVLSDGRIGIVAFYEPTNPTRPHIRVLDLETDITNIKVEYVNLERQKTLFIVDTWDINELKNGFRPKPKPKESWRQQLEIYETKLIKAT